MPRSKKSGDAMVPPGGQQPAKRTRKKKEPVNNAYDIKPEANMGYDMQGMPNGMGMMPPPDDGIQYNHGMPPDFYYQHAGPTSTPSGSMNNGFGPPSLNHGGPPPGSAQPMPYQDMDPNQPPPHQIPPPPYNMHPMNLPPQQPPPNMMTPQPGLPPPNINQGPGNPGNPQQNTGGPPPQMILTRDLPDMPPVPMAHFPQPPLLEYRIFEMNKRMYSFYHQQYQVASEHHGQWWEAFGQEFFDDDSRMNVIAYETIDNPKKYSIGRKLISKFFRTMFDTGVRELHFLPRSPSSEQMSNWGGSSLDCENVVMFTKLTKPFNAQAVTDARMFIEFAPYDEAYGYRIKQLTLELKNTQEYISRECQGMVETQERIKQGVTKCGLPPKAMNFLKLCVIMEPMQHIMSYCKQDPRMLPRDALKNMLFNAHMSLKKSMPPQMPPQNMPPMPPGPSGPQPNLMSQQSLIEEPPKKPQRKRQRKTNSAAAGGAGGPNATPTPTKQRKGGNSRTSPSQNVNNFPMNQNYNHPQYQEVLVVGEPSLMGGDFGEEDERSISRIENTQYDVSMMGHGPGSGMLHTPMSVGMMTNGSTPNYSRQNSFNRNIEGVKMPPPLAAPLVHTPSSSQLTMLPPPPPSYDVSLMNNGWKGMPNPSNNMNPLMAQTICDQ